MKDTVAADVQRMFYLYLFNIQGAKRGSRTTGKINFWENLILERGNNKHPLNLIFLYFSIVSHWLKILKTFSFFLRFFFLFQGNSEDHSSWVCVFFFFLFHQKALKVLLDAIIILDIITKSSNTNIYLIPDRIYYEHI